MKYFKNRIKSDPWLFAVMVIFLAFFMASGIYFAVLGQSRNCTMSFLFMLIIPAFYIIEYLLKLRVSVWFGAFLMLFSAGTIMGACYDVYTYVPVFDTILHGMWGVVFIVMGFAIFKKFVGEPKTHKEYFACLLFGFAFCLAAAFVWELFEYTGYVVGGYDMEEDQIITEFWSYWLSEGHLHLETVHIEGIAKTVLFDAEGNEILTIEGGYLELGLIDTIVDMAICFVCAVIFFALMTGDWFLKKYLYRWLVPVLVEKQPEACPEQEAESGAEPDGDKEIAEEEIKDGGQEE